MLLFYTFICNVISSSLHAVTASSVSLSLIYSQPMVSVRRARDSPLCSSRPPPRAQLAVHARGSRGREEEDDVAREGEMAAENKPEGKRNRTGFNLTQ